MIFSPVCILQYALVRKRSNLELAGVELEEAGEKWRAGDAVKSMRFFIRAIVNYDEGLQKHPGTFDLAYNK